MFLEQGFITPAHWMTSQDSGNPARAMLDDYCIRTATWSVTHVMNGTLQEHFFFQIEKISTSKFQK